MWWADPGTFRPSGLARNDAGLMAEEAGSRTGEALGPSRRLSATSASSWLRTGRTNRDEAVAFEVFEDLVERGALHAEHRGRRALRQWRLAVDGLVRQ